MVLKPMVASKPETIKGCVDFAGLMVDNYTMSTQAQTYQPSPIHFSDAAAAKVLELIEEEGNPKLSLRAFITGGGCSGFQYGFTFDEEIATDDTVIEKVIGDDDEDREGDGGHVKLVVDIMSLQYLMGAKIDYKEDINGSQFTITNPNAKTTCGCGSSFGV